MALGMALFGEYMKNSQFCKKYGKFKTALNRGFDVN